MTGNGNGSLRAERAAEVRRRRDAGESYHKTCAAMGIGRSYYYELLNDPEGLAVRARKDSYRATCETCGRPTDGSNGVSGAPTECVTCWHERKHAERRWTRETIVAAIREFERRYSAQPTATDFNPTAARVLGHPHRAERFERDGIYPPTVTVQREWGTWNAAIEAAGFEPQLQQAYHDPSVRERAAQRYNSGLSATAVAAEFGVAPTTVLKWLGWLGIPRRSPSEAQRLRWERERNGHEATAADAGQPQASPEPERSGGPK